MAGIFAGTLPAHDGRKTLFSARPLAITNDEGSAQVNRSRRLQIILTRRSARVLNSGDIRIQSRAWFCLNPRVRTHLGPGELRGADVRHPDSESRPAKFAGKFQ